MAGEIAKNADWLMTLPDMSVSDHAEGRPEKGAPRTSLIERSALGPTIARLDALGYSKAAISRRLGLSPDQVERFAKEPGYLALKAEAHDLLLAELDHNIGLFLRDMVIENYRELQRMALSKDTRPDVRAKIRMFMIDKAEEYATRGAGRGGDVLKEIYEATQREAADGTVTRTLKQTLERPAFPAGSGREAGPERGSGEASGVVSDQEDP